MDAIGLAWGRVRPCLPDWTEDALSHSAGALEVEGYVAKHFGLRIRAGGGFDRDALPPALFKLRHGTTQEAVSMSRQVATSVARLVASAMDRPCAVPSVSVDRLRALAKAAASGNPDWVAFSGLVEASWKEGVPVVYLPNVPAQGKKPDGMATFVAGRPVIVLMKAANAASDWLLFVLAHELGHVGLGHLGHQEGDAIVDEAVSPNEEDAGLAHDEQEMAANLFATDTLIPNGQQINFTRLLKAEVLAPGAIEYGRKHGVSPGHVVLNAAWNSPLKPYPLANAALSRINEILGVGSTHEICSSALRRHVDLDNLKEDSVEFLEKIGVI